MASAFIIVKIQKAEYAPNKTHRKRGKRCSFSRCRPEDGFE